MKTCSRPSRGSTHIAVRIIHGADSWSEAWRVGSSKVSFPLTPALSLGEREERSPLSSESPRLPDCDARCFATSLSDWLPLPWGEGWGEGEPPPRRNRCLGNSLGNSGSFAEGSCWHVHG